MMRLLWCSETNFFDGGGDGHAYQRCWRIVDRAGGSTRLKGALNEFRGNTLNTSTQTAQILDPPPVMATFPYCVRTFSLPYTHTIKP